jgi:hypothetical protein
MAILSNLYPPIVDTYMPAFVVNELKGTCKIYFSLSKYNTASDIKSIWVTVNNQYTNESVVNTATGLKVFSTLSVDSSRDGDDKYYITLQNEDIKDGWSLNQLYKVQIRFCSVAPPDNLTMNWVVNNSNLFSEWSTVCLIQGIAQPILELRNFTEALTGEETVFSTLNNNIVGQVLFEDNEQLESYHFEIFKNDNLTSPVFSSGVSYTNDYAPNEINHVLNYAFTDGEKYKMNFTYTTQSLYEKTTEFSFLVLENGGEPLSATIEADQDEEEGCITIHVTSSTARFFGNLTIRRAASDTDFTIWEDVHTTSITNNDFLDFTWKDYTVESGIWYKYGVQKRNSYGDRGLLIITQKPVMVTLQDMFLTRADKQLKIKFNPQVSSFKHTLSESVTQTLGSKYPFIKRNGNVNYRQFSITGLISHFCDENQLFITEDELYKHRKDLYDAYNEENRINVYNDFTLERTFREKVQEFLYENNVKLFRSPAEGNILVRLMDISFSPEQTLGRMVYSFSATAYEIDAISFDNFEKYGIQKVGEVSEQVVHSYSKVGQLSGNLSGDILSQLQDWENRTSGKGLKKTIKYINGLQLDIQSAPYLINPTGYEPQIVTEESETNETTVLGYLVKINGTWVIIGAHGQYSLKDDNIEITSLEFPTTVNTDVLLSYDCLIEEAEDISLLARQVHFTSRVGQLWGGFKPLDNLISIIKQKYEIMNNHWYQLVYGINSMTLELDPNTIFYLKDSSDDKYRRYSMGDIGSLHIEDENFLIEGCYLLGSHLEAKETDNEGYYKYVETKDYEFVDKTGEGVYKTIADIKTPIKNGVYAVENIKGLSYEVTGISGSEDDYCRQLIEALETYDPISGWRDIYKVIYFQKNWYLFSRENDVVKPVQALVDYVYEQERGEY